MTQTIYQPFNKKLESQFDAVAVLESQFDAAAVLESQFDSAAVNRS